MKRVYLEDVPGKEEMLTFISNRDKKYDKAEERRKASELNRNKKDINYEIEKAKRDSIAAEELNKRKDVVMSALSSSANSVPFSGSEVREAAEGQRQDKVDKWHTIRTGIDATMTAGEGLAASYGLLRGISHINRYLATRGSLSNLNRWNRMVDIMDKPQIVMNSIGGAADAYQWLTADNSFDAWENGLETGANAAGVIGGTNWFRQLPVARRLGTRIDDILDGLGYGAAVWDIVKNIPPLSNALENIREKSKSKKE